LADRMMDISSPRPFDIFGIVCFVLWVTVWRSGAENTYGSWVYDLLSLFARG
jgi:hypothetical protein